MVPYYPLVVCMVGFLLVLVTFLASVNLLVAKLLYMELAAAPLDASKVTWIEDGGSRFTFNFILT